MFNFQSGVLERTRLVSNVLMLLLLIGNIFFSIQYISNLKAEAVQKDDNTTYRIQVSRFLKSFIDIVINTQGTVSFDDRVKLENDIRQIHDTDLIRLWDAFVGSKDTKEAQVNAVKLMSLLATKTL
jgi:hypothetical protein